MTDLVTDAIELIVAQRHRHRATVQTRQTVQIEPQPATPYRIVVDTPELVEVMFSVDVQNETESIELEQNSERS